MLERRLVSQIPSYDPEATDDRCEVVGQRVARQREAISDGAWDEDAVLEHVAFLQYSRTAVAHAGDMNAVETYEGSCHCGAVKFEVAMPLPTKAFACNCSICSRAGWLLAFAKGDAFKLLAGDDAVTDYQFGKKKIHHVFCKTCGIRAYSRGTDKDGAPTAAINLRCVARVDAAALPVETFDGASL